MIIFFTWFGAIVFFFILIIIVRVWFEFSRVGSCVFFFFKYVLLGSLFKLTERHIQFLDSAGWPHRSKANMWLFKQLKKRAKK